MRLRLLIIALLAFTFAQSKTYEHFSLVKDPRILGMGGANIALGGSASSVFTNSAGLAKIPQEYGTEFKLLGANLGAGENSMDFYKDLKDAKTDDNSEILALLEEYQGENIHIGLDLEAMSFARNFDGFALALVPFGGFLTNMKTHSGFGSAGLLETNGIAYGGLAIAMAKTLEDLGSLNNLSIGGGVKIVNSYVWSHEMLVSEIVDHKDDIGKYLLDDVASKKSNVVFDVGAIYDVWNGIDLGVSFQNIGGIGEEDKVEIPMTFGIGLGYTLHDSDRAFFNEFRFGIDYVDVLEGYEDDSLKKRTRLGVNTNVIDSSLAGLRLGAGLYQGNLSLGVDVRLAFLRLSYAMYKEEISSKAGSETDKRQSLGFSIEF